MNIIEKHTHPSRKDTYPNQTWAKSWLLHICIVAFINLYHVFAALLRNENSLRRKENIWNKGRCAVVVCVARNKSKMWQHTQIFCPWQIVFCCHTGDAAILCWCLLLSFTFQNSTSWNVFVNLFCQRSCFKILLTPELTILDQVLYGVIVMITIYLLFLWYWDYQNPNFPSTQINILLCFSE